MSDKRKPPNILVILSDQHRSTALNCDGNSDVITPNFDQLAGEGSRFTNCLSSCPVCAPYRATFQTGLHSHQHGVQKNQSPWLGQQFRSLADYFNEESYETCFIGKAHWGLYLYYNKPWIGGYVPPERRMRWKHWYGMDGHAQYDSALYHDDGTVARDFKDQHQPTVQTDLAMEQIRSFGSRSWFLQLNWGPPHTVMGKVQKKGEELLNICRQVNRDYGFGFDESFFTPSTKNLNLLFPQHLICDPILPPKFLDLYDPNQLSVDPNVEARFRKLVSFHLKEYYSLVTSLDTELGRLMDFLKESGQDKNTIVIYTSDHGDRIGAHCTLEKFRTKSTWHQNSVRVPLIVWGPHQGVKQGQVNRTPICSVDFLPTFLDLVGVTVQPHLPGLSFLSSIRGDCVERDRHVLLSLDSWRGIFDGRYLYAIKGQDDTWEAVSLIDTKMDPYDLNNLVHMLAHAERQSCLHESLIAELIRTSDHAFVLQHHLGERHR